MIIFSASKYDYGRGGDSKEYYGFGWAGGARSGGGGGGEEDGEDYGEGASGGAGFYGYGGAYAAEPTFGKTTSILFFILSSFLSFFRSFYF